jgi:hypothetical protein
MLGWDIFIVTGVVLVLAIAVAVVLIARSERGSP